MDLRLAMYETAAAQGLDARAERCLLDLAGLDREPARVVEWLPLAVAVLAAALGGLGIVFWIAANWQGLGRFARFGLLELLLLAMAAAALSRPAARAPLGLVALLTIGGVFAYFGQTYQTGADAWLLFAFWAGLALPLCLGVRSDVLWAAWALIAATGISLWVYAHTGHSWRLRGAADLRAYRLGWGAALVLVGAMTAPLRPRTGAGPWALRTALTLTAAMIASSALVDLFDAHTVLVYVLGLALLAGTAVAFASPRGFDVYALSVLALALDVLVVCGMARLVIEATNGRDWISFFLLIGLAAAGLVAGTVTAVLRLSRLRAAASAP